jgi:hypothetical protein
MRRVQFTGGTGKSMLLAGLAALLPMGVPLDVQTRRMAMERECMPKPKRYRKPKPKAPREREGRKVHRIKGIRP